MSIAMNTDCMICHIRRSLETAKSLGDGKTAMAFAKELLKLHIAAPEGAGSPWLGPGTMKLFEQFYGLEADRFREEKAFSNRFVMERYAEIEAQIQTQPDPVLAGLKFSILGNYLDFSALQGQVSFEKLEQMLRQALTMDLDMDTYHSLQKELTRGKKVLFLTDNAGEIGFDRLFAEQLQKVYPHLEITFCVRGGPIHNDATREDAAFVQIPFPVIDSGHAVGGTELSLLSAEAKRAMDNADVIIAKGMGNTESLYGCGYPIYYAFMVKCIRFVQQFGKDLFTPMLVREQA